MPPVAARGRETEHTLEEKMLKTVLMSLVVIGVVGGMVGGGLFAHFQDTETSEGNTFTAGFIDVEIDLDLDGDGTSGELEGPNEDLDGDGRFGENEWFNGIPFPLFPDVDDWKPCTHYEQTLSIHLIEGSNDCPVWLDLRTVLDDENGMIEPEVEAGDITPGDPTDPNDGEGELDNYVMIKVWHDNGPDGIPGSGDEGEGDNIHQTEEQIIREAYAGAALPITDLLLGTLEACVTYYIGIDVHFLQLDDEDVSDAMTDQWGIACTVRAVHP
jgi:predicted ribosomally synthesized peptide with SipW-like signal peptide